MADEPTQDDLEPKEDQLYPASGRVEGEDNIHPLPQDNDPPASDPTDPMGIPTDDLDARSSANHLNPQHQITDTNIDMTERYDEGLAGAAGAQDDPNAGDTVIGYNPAEDQRKSSRN